MVADVPVGVLLSGGIDSSIVVALLAEMGQKDLKTFSIGFESEGGEAGDEFDYSDLVAKTYGTDHVKFTVPKHETDDALAGRGRGDGRADGQPRRRRLLPALPRGLEVDQGGAVGPGRRRDPRRLRLVPAAGRASPATAPSTPTRRRSSTARTPRSPQLLTPEALVDDDVSRAFVAEHFGRPGADSAVDAALRLDTTIMLVDDPVKRVDNMTMAWGLEARVPFLDHEFVETMGACPPEYKLADGGKGVLKAAARGVLPDEIIDRKKGYFPVPAIRQLSGPVLERVRGRAHRPGRDVAGPVPGRRGGDDARRPELRPHQPRGQRAVAGRPARDVAAGARHHLTYGAPRR